MANTMGIPVANLASVNPRFCVIRLRITWLRCTGPFLWFVSNRMRFTCDQLRPRVNGIFITLTNHAGISTEYSIEYTHKLRRAVLVVHVQQNSVNLLGVKRG